MTKLKLNNLNAAIKKDNEAFNKLTKAEKRVAIAKDVLAGLASGKLIADSGTYCEINRNEKADFETTNLQTLLKSKTVDSCAVCGVGSLFVSLVKKTNKFNIGDGETTLLFSEDIYAKLHAFFTDKQLALIECAFEGEEIANEWNEDGEELSGNELNKCQEFYDQNCDSDYGRLVAIMKNIIKNKGTFKL